MSLPRQRRAPRRGAATVEFAVTVPLLVIILLFSMYLTELVRAKLKLLEMARYATWEMTSYTLSDFAKAEHDAAFEDARREALEEARERFKDMDSVEDNAPAGTFIARYANVEVDLLNKEVPFIEAGLVLGNSGEGYADAVLGAVNGGASGLLGFWRFNTKGWVESRVGMRFQNAILPRSYLDETGGGQRSFFKENMFGGRDLNDLRLSAHHSMYATGWHLPDGSDAIVKGRRSGAHTGGDEAHGLYLQVNRMTYLGVKERIEGSPLGAILDFFKAFSPAFLGTFVVSKNYGLPDTLRCEGVNSYPASASHGVQDQMSGDKELLDYERPQCFDTAPFRDNTFAKAQYIKIFESRGEHFMGCKNPQAEDPSAPTSTEATKGDKNEDIINCE